MKHPGADFSAYGHEPGWQPGDWETLFKQVHDANTAAGLTRSDASAIEERGSAFGCALNWSTQGIHEIVAEVR